MDYVQYYGRLQALAPGDLDAVAQDLAFLSTLKQLARDEQDRVLQLVCRDRVQELSLASRVTLLTALQKGHTRHSHQLAMSDLFLATTGEDLTRLKRAVDRAPDHHCLNHLLYHDIEAPSLREEILRHFRQQAAAHPCPELKVISDVDDTFYRNWVDPRYPPRTVYPGVVQLHKELDLASPDAEPGDVVFLTGRPGGPGLQRYYRRRLGALGAEEITLITGSVLYQLFRPWILSRKWLNFERVQAFYPEMAIVMFGDSGQSDPELLTRARERYPDQVKAALLHMVVPLCPERLRACLQRGVLPFETYVGAALHLHHRQLLSDAGLQRVARTAWTNLRAIHFPDPAMGQARERELDRDLGAVRLALAGAPPSLPVGAP